MSSSRALSTLVPVVALTSVAAQVLPTAPFEHTPRSYHRVAELPPAPELFPPGQAQVDLSGLALTEDVTYAAQLEMGQLEVKVPDDVNVAIRYDVDLGAVQAFGLETASGFDLLGTTEPTALLSTRPTLTLDLTVDAGQVSVIR